MAKSGLIPDANCTSISTSFAVLSMTFLTLIFPLSLALMILSISDPVVVPKGISLISKVDLSFSSIFERTRIRDPFLPSLYIEKSAYPPVGKSGNKFTFFPFNTSMLASHNSKKLWGIILVLNPTAIPSTPWAKSNGNFMGRVTGSRFLPS